MIELFKALSLIALTISGAFIALLLRPPASTLHKLTALFLGALSIPLAYNYLRLNHWALAHFFEAAAHSMLLAYGPLLWALLRTALKKTIPYPKLQGAPFLVIAVYKLFFYDQQLSTVISVLFFAHIAFYTGCLFNEVWQSKGQWRVIIQQYPLTQHYWLMWLAAGVAAIELLDLTLVTLHMQGMPINFLLWQGVMFGLVFYILLIVTASYLSPQWLLARELTPHAPLNDTPLPITLPTTRATELAASAAHELSTQLNSLIINEGIYQRNDLALEDIAKALNISRHQASELLNVHIGMSFYDYINRHRVEHACRLLQQRSPLLPILQVAFDAGFNNKNSFYKSFKHMKGCTPSEYRAANCEQSLCAPVAITQP